MLSWFLVAYGGDSSSVSAKLASGVVSVSSTLTAFAAIKNDGSVVTWGDSDKFCLWLWLVWFVVFCCCFLLVFVLGVYLCAILELFFCCLVSMQGTVVILIQCLQNWPVEWPVCLLLGTLLPLSRTMVRY